LRVVQENREISPSNKFLFKSTFYLQSFTSQHTFYCFLLQKSWNNLKTFQLMLQKMVQRWLQGQIYFQILRLQILFFTFLWKLKLKDPQISWNSESIHWLAFYQTFNSKLLTWQILDSRFISDFLTFLVHFFNFKNYFCKSHPLQTCQSYPQIIWISPTHSYHRSSKYHQKISKLTDYLNSVTSTLRNSKL
jgi:hypothetical protein